MTFTRKNNSGNAIVMVLLALVIIVAGIGAYLYFKRVAPTDALPETTEMSQTAPIEETAVETDETGNAVPFTEEVEATGEPVEIDVAAASSVRGIGDVNAPIKIIEYASMTCSHCGHFHNDVLPALKSKYIDTGKVYMEFREFPLNDPALKATLTARCLPEDKYESFVALLFKTQGQWDSGLDYMKALEQNAKLAGMSKATFDACQAEPMLKLKIAENMQEAKDKWKISATPTFVINDGAEVISGAQPLQEFERVFRKITGDAVGEAPAVE